MVEIHDREKHDFKNDTVELNINYIRPAPAISF